MVIATCLIGIKSFKKRLSVSDPFDNISCQNVVTHLPIYPSPRQECKGCNEKVIKSSTTCKIATDLCDEDSKSYDKSH